MLELLIGVCLVDDPSHCRDVHLTFDVAQVTPGQCVMNGQIAMAEWSGEHPNWRIVKWACIPAGQEAKL